jgi:hypothetical protein
MRIGVGWRIAPNPVFLRVCRGLSLSARLVGVSFDCVAGIFRGISVDDGRVDIFTVLSFT